jgi:hypothetical protein
MIEPAPGAARQTVGSLEAGDPGLDPGAEVTQLTIDPAALDHVFDRQATLLVEGDILDAARLGRCEIVLAGITAIGGDLPRRHAATGDLAFEHRQEALGIGGVAGLDDDIEDQAAVAGDQVELVSVGAPLLRVVHGDNFHRSANLVHPYLAVADHNALVAGEQIVSLGSSDGALTSGVKTRA